MRKYLFLQGQGTKMAEGSTLDNTGGTDWWGMAESGLQGLGAYADYKSGRDSAKDLAKAYAATAEQAQGDALKASSMSDPFQEYRPGFAKQLAGIISGETDFRTDPGYRFRMDEAMQETERAGAARGFNRSGNIMAALNERAQSVASTEYSNIINRLTGLAGATPQNAISGGQTFGNMMGNVYSAQMSGAANQSQAGGASGLGGLLGGIGGMLGGMGDMF